MAAVTLSALVILTSLFGFGAAAPVKTFQQAMHYLAQFGYLSSSARNPSSSELLHHETWTKAIKDFQAFAGLNVTGELDVDTKELMSLPRCGLQDKVRYGESRSKRYALQGSRWTVNNLTYKISKYSKKLRQSEVDVEISRAFNVWSEYTDLTFTQKASGPVDIEISFEENEHGNCDPFDGPGGTVGHTFFPAYGGNAHFDDAETWTIDSSNGVNLFQTAAHEFGHSLGLSHSDVTSALMTPFYRGFQPVFKLDSDDIAAIQALYGKTTVSIVSRGSNYPTVSSETTPTFVPLGDENELCKDPRIDAIFNTAKGKTYVFKGDKYYRLTGDAIAKGYPKLISEGWPGLEGDIDAAFTYKNGETYFFKGTKYWRYDGRRTSGFYPREISAVFVGIPDYIDAAMFHSDTGKIYFYKGTTFWRFDPLTQPSVKRTYSRPISNWKGLPNNLDAALQHTDGFTYFFKGDKYYRFNDTIFSVDEVIPPFPRQTAYWWFGCGNVSSVLGP